MNYLINLIDLGIAVIITAFILFIIQTIETILIYRKIIKMYNNTITMQELFNKTISIFSDEEKKEFTKDKNFIEYEKEKLEKLKKLIGLKKDEKKL